MPLLDDVERWFVDARVERVQRREHSWTFAFLGGGSRRANLDVEHAWRLIKDGGLVVTDREDGATAGRDVPIDAEAIAASILEVRRVVTARVDSETADLSLSFEGGVRLEILTISTLYGSWQLIGDGIEAAVQEGRLFDPAWFIKGSGEATDA
ncbi:hypothetical protein [Phenylobacterium sp.]|uniref:hypothetical protein n=1 Tax=Phenylobacterium sp. TaxID=1871053 RepID=UPI003D27BAAD